MVYAIEIVNKDSKKFQLLEAECPSGTYSLSTKLFRQAMPGESADKGIVINLGRESDTSYNFNLRNTPGDDAADGTHSADVGTIQEKIDYLLETFITDGIEDLYTININSNNVVLSLQGILESFTINFASEKPNLLPGSIAFSIGGANQQ